MRTVFLSLLLLLCGVSLNAQSIRSIRSEKKGIRDDISVRKRKPTATKSQPPRMEVETKKVEQNAKSDTVYCFQTKKQYGWFAPVGIISKDVASHRNLSFRFTHKNAQGNWCKMELIDGYGNYTTGGISPYILKVTSAESDSLADKEWVGKIKTSCIFEFIADPTGKNVIQERAYDKNKNIIYTYSRTPIGKNENGRNQFVGSYRDFYGLPAEMRKDTTNTYTYGTLVMLTEDVWGNDSIVEYMDAKGVKKLNSDSVAMEVFVCDKDGNLLKQQSCDSRGNLVIDNWGNCGIEFTVNDKHLTTSATYMNDKWKPMRMPMRREVSSSFAHNTIKQIYKYDKYYRQIETSFHLYDDSPDQNVNGAHKQVWTFDDYGNTTNMAFYDLQNKLINGQNDGMAIYKATYNKAGKPLNRYWFNKDSILYYKENIEYDVKGEQLLCKGYVVKEGKDSLAYLMGRIGNVVYDYWGNQTFTDSLDNKGRDFKKVWYGADGKLNKNGMAYQIFTYKDSNQKTYYSIRNYDSNHKLYNDEYGVAQYNHLVDSIRKTDKRMDYNNKGEIVQSLAFKYDDKFNIIGEYDMNKFGVFCRAGGTSGVRHFYAAAPYSRSGKSFTSLIAKDEFYEPDYVDTNSGLLYYYQRLSSKGSNAFYDEDSHKINDFEELRNRLPKVVTIEIVDSIAYTLGLKDNDIILQYGDFCVNLDSILSDNDFKARWSLLSVLQANESKDMIVFRVDPVTLQYNLVEIKDLKGYNSTLGFITHIRYLTRKQKERIQRTINTENLGNLILAKQKATANLSYFGGKAIAVCYADMYRNVRSSLYPRLVTDPSILLLSTIKDRDLQWSIQYDKFESFSKLSASKENVSGAYPTQYFLLTKNMTDVISLSLKERFANMNIFKVSVSDEIYAKLLDLYKQELPKFKNFTNKEPEIKTKELIGKWSTIIPSSNDIDEGEAQLILSKDRSFTFNIIAKKAMPISSTSTINICFEVNIAGSYRHKGSILSLEDISSKNLMVKEIKGCDEELAKQIREFIEQGKDVLLNSLTANSVLGEVIIRSIDKNKLVIADNPDKIFVRFK